MTEASRGRRRVILIRITSYNVCYTKLLRVFALTYQVEFFHKLGFEEIDKTLLPQKIWADCIKCVKFPDCDETAMIYPVYDETSAQ